MTTPKLIKLGSGGGGKIDGEGHNEKIWTKKRGKEISGILYAKWKSRLDDYPKVDEPQDCEQDDEDCIVHI